MAVSASGASSAPLASFVKYVPEEVGGKKNKKYKPTKLYRRKKKQTAGRPAWLLEPEARSTSEGIIDDAPYSCMEKMTSKDM